MQRLVSFRLQLNRDTAKRLRPKAQGCFNPGYTREMIQQPQRGCVHHGPQMKRTNGIDALIARLNRVAVDDT